MQLSDGIGIAAGICTAIASVPQLVKIIREKKAEDISYFMLIILLVGLAGWTGYGVLKKDYPIILTNAFSLMINISLLIFSIKYKK